MEPAETNKIADTYSPFISPADLGLSGDPAPTDLSSLDPPFSPKWNWGLFGTYFADLSQGSLTFYGGLHYQSEYQTSSFPANFQGADAAGNPIIIQKAFTQVEQRTLLDASIAWTSEDENWVVTLYGKNLTEQVWRQSSNPVATLWNFTGIAPPRELGIAAKFHF